MARSVTAAGLKKKDDEWLADRRKEIDAALSELRRKEEVLRAEKDTIEAEFFRRFNERKSHSTTTDRWTVVRIIDDKYPIIEDRQAFEAYVLEQRAMHLLQKRLLLGAVQDEVKAGKVIPGIRMIKKETINQRKR